MIQAECPHCQQSITVGDEFAGRPMRCPHCSQEMTLPHNAPPPPPPRPMATPAGPVRVVPGSEHRTPGQATASLVLGILSFLCLGPLASIPGVILGHLGLSKITANPETYGGRGVAVGGLIIGYANLVITIILIPLMLAITLPALARAREAARRSSCQNNLKQMAIVYKMFANESTGGRYPQVSPEAGKLMFFNGPYEGDVQVYPEYVSDLSVMLCPSNPATVDITNPEAAIDDHSYFYLGYVVTNEEELRAFADAYRARVEAGLPLEGDLEVPEGSGTGGGNMILQLREGVERFLITAIGDPSAPARTQATIPIMWDRCTLISGDTPAFVHIPQGGNVLYMDGHVEYVRYGTWPLTPEALAIFTELDEM